MNKVFKALSDETRREILRLLNKGDMAMGDIASNFDMSKPAISKHLDILKSAKLITSEKKGQFIIYSINTSVIQQALGGFLDIFSKGEGDNI
ncbi:MAG: autorepressor SdpR family transcription factor [Clostridium perfringens]|nr:autorepressor SdpR family transcription factor [Clostridium perfringens]